MRSCRATWRFSIPSAHPSTIRARKCQTLRAFRTPRPFLKLRSIFFAQCNGLGRSAHAVWIPTTANRLSFYADFLLRTLRFPVILVATIAARNGHFIRRFARATWGGRRKISAFQAQSRLHYPALTVFCLTAMLHARMALEQDVTGTASVSFYVESDKARMPQSQRRLGVRCLARESRPPELLGTPAGYQQNRNKFRQSVRCR